MYLREIGWEGVEWIHTAQGRDWWWAFVNTVMNLRVLVLWSWWHRGCSMRSFSVVCDCNISDVSNKL
jgi:hypothetical protein